MHGHHATALALPEPDARSDRELPPWPNHGPELLGVFRLGKEIEDLGLASSFGVAEEPRGKDTAPVDHQEVAFSKIVREAREPAVREDAARAVEDEKPRGVSIL
jgi:hypothetical protein